MVDDQAFLLNAWLLMLGRFVVGLLKGLLVGLAVSVPLQYFGLGILGSALLAYPLVVVLGVLTGFVAGRPIWARSARIEAYLKGVVGALLASGGLYALRAWVPLPVPELPGHIGGAELGAVAPLAFPLIASVIGVLFELDNTREKEPAEQQVRVEPAQHKRVETAEDPAVMAEIEADLRRHSRQD